MPERGDNKQESGEDGRTRYEQQQFKAALGGTASDPNGTKVESGWKPGALDRLGTGSDQGQGAKEETGSRISERLSGNDLDR